MSSTTKGLAGTSYASPFGRQDAFDSQRKTVLTLMEARGLEVDSFAETSISPHHIDYMGHVGNAHYSTFMNVSHNRLVIGVFTRMVDEEFATALAFAKKVALVPVKITTAFGLPVGFPDAVISGGRFSQITDKSINIIYELYSLKTTLRVATVEVESKLVDPKTGRALMISQLPEPWPTLQVKLSMRREQSQAKAEAQDRAAKEKRKQRSKEVEDVKKFGDKKADWGKL